MGNLNSRKQNIQEGIPLIKEWIERKRPEYKENTDFKELEKIVKEIETENDYSKDAFDDIRYLLRPFEYIPLKIKRIFNIGTLDNYTMFIASRHFESIDDFINLEIGIKRFNGNMTKFHYNPIPLTNTTRKLFDHLQTLYIYSPNDNQFKDDERIIAREIQLVPYYLKCSALVVDKCKTRFRNKCFYLVYNYLNLSSPFLCS